MVPDPPVPAATRSSKETANPQSEATSSTAVSHSEDDSGSENQQKSVRRKRKAHKSSENVKRKSARASCSSASQSGSGYSRRSQVMTVTLFEVITMSRGAMEVVIDNWVKEYKADRDTSLLDLISFFIQCCGCKGVVTAEMFQSAEDCDVRSKMVEELDEAAGLQYKKFLAFPWILTVTWPMNTVSVDYPLVQGYGRWFYNDFCKFMSVLVAQCQREIIFDGYLMNSLISLLTELSDSYVRAFRHTCTLAAVKLLSSLVSIALTFSAGIENIKKLQRVQKTTRQKNAQEKKITELQEKRTEIESMMDVIFKGVFLKRYRDVLPEIRSICMKELGVWMKLYSSGYLNDTCLKYMGWMINDKIPDVRLTCVLALQNLYGDPLLLPKLDLLTSRYKDRLISMILDTDSEVAVQTMKLLVLFSKTSEDLLTSEDYKVLLQYVYSSHRPLAAIAGELLYSRLLNAAPAAADSQAEMSEEEKRQQRTFSQLKALLQFYQESELHDHVVYLVDSLWDCEGALLKDWSTLTSALLRDASSDGIGFTQEEQAVLVEILVASVRQTVEGPTLPGRSGTKRVASTKEKKLPVEDCLKLTEHLLPILPTLLSKFSGSCDIVASLLRIIQYFIPTSPEVENTEVVSSLMAEMEAVLDLQSGYVLVEEAARTYLSLCGDEAAAWCSMARSSRDALIQRWTERLQGLMNDCFQNEVFSADEEKMREFLSTLKKLRTFHNCHDLSRWNLFDLLSPLLSPEETPLEVLLEVLQCLCYYMLWSLNTSGETLTNRDKAVAQWLQLRLFCDRSQRCLSHSDAGVRQQAFVGVCDVLTAHSYQLQVWDPAVFGPLVFGPLIYTPSPKLQRALLTFTYTHVFVGLEVDSQSRASGEAEVERLEDLHRRRNLLAAFCKLVVHGVLEMSIASEVYMFYIKYCNEFGDIIKETIHRTREMDKIESSRSLELCLQKLFVRLKRVQQGIARSYPGLQTFSSIKDLAWRFALTFGDMVKLREGVVMIHRNGIEFVFQEFSQTSETPAPPYLAYLIILAQFSNKLLKPDRRTVFSYLQSHTAEHVIDLQDERWQPLEYYRDTVLAGADLDAEDAASLGSSERKIQQAICSSFPRHKPEGSKSLCPVVPAESKAGRDPSHLGRTGDMEPPSAPPEPVFVPPEPPSALPEPPSALPEPPSALPEPPSVPPESLPVPSESLSVPPEPVFVAPEPVFVAPEPVFVAPEPPSAPPEPVSVPPEPVFVAPEPPPAPPQPPATDLDDLSGTELDDSTVEVEF